MIKKCVVCGKGFEAIRSDARYCSNKCAQKGWKIKNGKCFDSKAKKCIICGAEFKPIRTGHICCSPKCTRKRNASVTKQQKKNRYYEEVQRKKVKEAMPKSNHKTIADIAIEARKQGMTYGQYVVKMGL